MKQDIDTAFIRAIPKTDLHMHLDGSIRLSTLVEEAARQQIDLPASTESGLKKTVFKDAYNNLAEYLKGFALTCSILNDLKVLERVAYELVQDNIKDGIRYAEIRFAPQLHLNGGLGMRDILCAVNRGLSRGQWEFNESDAVQKGEDLPFEYGIITCAMRRFNDKMGDYYAGLIHSMPHAPEREVYAAASLDLVRAVVQIKEDEQLPIVGFDLAGEESGYPAIYHKRAFQYAHGYFLRKTVHAGEAYGPESIFQAITKCHANRIGHGTFLFATEQVRDPDIPNPTRYVDELAEYIANQRITLEVCLTSNLQTIPSITSIEHHPITKMLEHNLSISICTDNRLVSHTTVNHELELLTRHLPITAHQFRNIIIAGFKGSFYPGRYNEKRAFVRRVIDRYENLERAFGIAG